MNVDVVNFGEEVSVYIYLKTTEICLMLKAIEQFKFLLENSLS